MPSSPSEFLKGASKEPRIKGPRVPSIPKAPAKPILSKGPKALQGALKEAEKTSDPPAKPTEGPLALATEPEWRVYWALTRLKKVPNVDFNYRGEVQFLPSLALSAQLDFTMLDGSQIAIEIQGIYWHYEQGSQKIADDEFRRAQLSASGWTIIPIDEDDAMRDSLYYTKEALRGISHAHIDKPGFYPWE